MVRIGIRELRQHASRYLRRVEAGETIEVTDRGRPIALLAPIPTGSPLDRMRAAGDIAGGNVPLTGAPLPLPAGKESPSRVLKRMRSDER